MHSHAEHIEESKDGSHNWLAWLGVGASGVIAAPYIGKLFDYGSNYVPEVMANCGAGSGLALTVSNFIKDIPLVGEVLAKGGWEAAASSGIIGIGGMLLGNYIQKHYDKEGDIPWGKIIKYACLTTSIFISLPSILTGLSIGVGYLTTALFSMNAGNTALTAMKDTAGLATMSNMTAGAGIGSMLTHLFTCGGAALSVAGALFLDKDEAKNTHKHTEYKATNLTMEIASCSPVISGQECQISLRLLGENGKALSDADLRETHTKKLHLMLVDDSLNDYHHIHPEYDEKTGCFVANFTPQMQNGYSAWSDFQLQTGEAFVLKNQLPVARDYHIPPAISHSNFASADGFNMDISANPPLQSGKDSTLVLRITDAEGNPAKLQEIMGASGHLVAFSKDKKDYIHCHPMEEVSKNGELVFHVAPTNEGFGKFFLGIKVDGREATIPFGQYIQPKNRAQEIPNYWENSSHSQHTAQRGIA